MELSCEKVLDCLKQEFSGKFSFTYSTSEWKLNSPNGFKIEAKGSIIENLGTAIWYVDEQSITASFESKLSLPREQAIREVNASNAQLDFESNTMHIYLNDNNTIKAYIRQRLIKESDDYIKDFLGFSLVAGIVRLSWWSKMCVEYSKKRIEEETKRQEEEKKKEERRKKEEEERKRVEEVKRQEEAKRKAEEEARKKMEEEKKKAEAAIEKEKASENKVQSLLKGLLGKMKASGDDMSEGRWYAEKVGGDIETATKWKVSNKTKASFPSRMERVFNAAAEGLGKTLTPGKRENGFLLAEYGIGRFGYSYFIIEGECFDVAVHFSSNEFKNKEFAERMSLDVNDYLKKNEVILKLQGFDCSLNLGTRVSIRKDILFRDIEDGDLIDIIQNTTKSLMDVVQKINERKKWPLSREATFRKRQQLISESKLKIEELKSRVADCEADCARHKRDNYYIQKRAEARADLQKEKLRLEKLNSGVDLDKID